MPETPQSAEGRVIEAESFAPATLENCADEPIHIPGAIQPDGFLVACDMAGRIFRVSANVGEFLNRTPAHILQSTVDLELGRDVEQYRQRFLQDASLPESLEAELPGAKHPFTVHFVRHAPGFIIECLPCLDVQGAHAGFMRQQKGDIAALSKADELLTLLRAAASMLARATGFERTMVYRFDAEMNGEVVVEHAVGVAPRWLGHHFPHTDIPPQARALYLRNRVRTITDVGARRVPLLGLAAALHEPLDLSDSWLRAVSPLHIQYLENMEVGATLGISLVVRDQLWGMLVCHHRMAREISAATRLYCSILSEFVSNRIEKLLDQEEKLASAVLELEVERIVHAMLAAPSLIDGLKGEAGLLALLEADACIVRLMGQQVALGCAVPPALLASIIAHEHEREGFDLHCTQVLDDWFAWRADDPFHLSGALCVPLSRNSDDFILWLRSECAFEVVWAGDPSEGKFSSAGATEPLTPRASFKSWVELVRGKSLPWSIPQQFAARLLGQTIRNELTTELRLTRERELIMRELALRDQLTGLPSRRLLLDRIQQAIERSGRSRLTFALMFLDLDGFKCINDSFGHAVGDEVLRGVATRMGHVLRQIDTLARLGGDEFVVLLEELSPEEHDQTRARVEGVAEKLRSVVAEPIVVDHQPHRVTASVGIAVYGWSGTDFETLLEAADKAMYMSKNSGKNRIMWAS